MILSRKSEFIFPALQNAQCHASTLAELPDGRMLAAWFQGSRESASDVRIYWSLRGPDGWSSPRQIPAVKDAAHWNPVLFRAADGFITLYYKVSAEIHDWNTYFCTFDCGREKWSAPRELVPGDDSGGRGPVKNPPLQLTDGTILAPASYEVDRWTPFIDISEDGGSTWLPHEIPLPDLLVEVTPGKKELLGCIQPTLWRDAHGIVHAYMRSNGGHIVHSSSSNDGRTWAMAELTPLPNNNSGICVARSMDGRLVLATNAASGNWASRSQLDLLVSEDNGDHWELLTTLEFLPPESKAEFSYPTMLMRQDGTLCLTYTWLRQSVVYAEFVLRNL